MHQEHVVFAVARIERRREERATSQAVAQELIAIYSQDVDRADISRTLLRASRNGRLARSAGYTAEGGWFRYEYSLTAKGRSWLERLSESRSRGEEVGESEPEEGFVLNDDAAEPAKAWCAECDLAVGWEDRFCRSCGAEFDDGSQ